MPQQFSRIENNSKSLNPFRFSFAIAINMICKRVHIKSPIEYILFACKSTKAIQWAHKFKIKQLKS